MGRALVFVLALAAALCIAHAADAEKALRSQARTTATAEATEAENMYTSNAVDLEAASSENTNIDMSSSSQSNLEASADADLDLDASAAAGLGSEESMESGIGVSVDADLDMTDEEEEEDSIGADGGLSLSADLGVDLGADDISDFGKSDFDLTSIVRILQRMKYNIQQENIALAHDHRVQAKVCDDRIAAFTKQIDIWSTKVANAHKDQLTQDNIIAQLNDDIDRYDRHVNLKRQEVAKMNQELEIGKERRLAAKAVYHIKANNTLTVFRALDAIRDRLKQHIEVNGEKPTYEFKFREELQKAHVDLEDATVRSLLGNALQIFGNGAITKDDIINLHSMIALLVKDVMDYKDDLTRSEQMAVTVWLERKAQIAEQIAILTNDIDAKSRDRTLKHQRLLRVQEKIRELKEIQISLPKMMDVWAAERATVSKKCEADRTQSQMEAVSLKKQKALLLVINKVATASNELKMRLAEPITRVELPVSVVQTSRRCTKLCTSDTMQSCGVGCISNKQVCLAKKTYSCTLTVQEWAQLQLH